MTPLAHSIVRDSLLVSKDRQYGALGSTLGLHENTHFFECTGILEAATNLGFKAGDDLMAEGRLAFLPAPRTWLEFKVKGKRFATLLVENGSVADVYEIGMINPEWDVMLKKQLPLMGHSERGAVLMDPKAYDICTRAKKVDQFVNGSFAGAIVIYALLAMINSPRVIGRREYAPHRGLERDIIARHGTGRPVAGWTEMLLKVEPPVEVGATASLGPFTGGKALHFCRSYLRLSYGALQVVSSHWRGDPKLGTIHTRYRVEAPKGKVLAGVSTHAELG